MKQDSPWYRPDIDGLRGIAALVVVMIHFKSSSPGRLFINGELGLDIFFVISGYLITSILLRELRTKKFSFLKFWERRIRRILPALTVMILLVSSYQLWEGHEYPYHPNYGVSVVTQSFFVFNYYYLETIKPLEQHTKGSLYTGTILTVGDQGPLTPMWSLSVEEQFYFLLPFVLVFLFRHGQSSMSASLATLGLTSFILYIYLWGIAPTNQFAFSSPGVQNISAGFCILPARAWELLAGVLAALLNIKVKTSANALLSLGVGLLLIGFFYPVKAIDLYTMAPFCVIGSVLIIVAGKEADNWVKKILSAKPFVFVGTISYSIYLWHWPLFVFAGHPDSARVLIGLFILTMLISYLSYTYIEKPFLGKSKWSIKQVYIAGFSTIALTASLGLVIATLYP